MVTRQTVAFGFAGREGHCEWLESQVGFEILAGWVVERPYCQAVKKGQQQRPSGLELDYSQLKSSRPGIVVTFVNNHFSIDFFHHR